MKTGILLLLKTPPPWGGGEVCALQLLERFRDRRGVRVLELRSRNRSRANQGTVSLAKIGEQLIDFSRYLASMAQYRPERVYINFGRGLAPFLRDSAYVTVARSLGAKVYAELAGERFDVLDSKSELVRAHAIRTLRKMESIRVLGTSIKERLEEHGISNSVVIDNGVQVPAVRSGVARAGKKGARGISVLFLGLHGPSKGFDVLVRACAILEARGCPFSLSTAGEWVSSAFRLEMERLMTSASIDARVRTHGGVVGEAKWELFRDADVVVLPSETEGQPLVLLEAMGFGLPVVATGVGGVSDIIEDGVNGVVLESREADALADALCWLEANPAERRRIGERNRKKYLERFTEQRFLDRMEEWLGA